MLILIITSCLAFLVSFSLTPLVRRLAIRYGLVDRPDRQRKLHGTTTPLGGGLAVFGGVLVALCAAVSIPSPWQFDLSEDSRFLVGLFVSAFVVCAVGLIDDRFRLRGRQKLAGQIVAVGALIATGLVIRNVQAFGWTVELGLLSVPFTMFWLLGAINALNLIDGVDGLAGSVGLIIALALAAMAFQTGHESDAMIAVAVAGAALGFLYYNLPPARIFLGDTGSMLIGLVLGAVAIRGSLKGPATIALAAPTAIWAIPLLDVGMAIVRRKLTGRSIYATDRGHLHHLLQQRGYSSRKTLLFIGLLCAVTAAGGLISVYRQNELLAFGCVAAVMATLTVTRFFGHVECSLVCRRMSSLIRSMNPFVGADAAKSSHEVRTLLQGNRQWDDLWKTLVAFAERFGLNTVQLNVTLPAIHEEYHARWDQPEQRAVTDQWVTDIPLVVRNTTVGRLRIGGSCPNGSVCTWMGELIAGLKPFETQMQSLIEESQFDMVPHTKNDADHSDPNQPHSVAHTAVNS